MSLGDKAKLTGEKISESLAQTKDDVKHAYNKGVIDAKEKANEERCEASHQTEKAKIDAERNKEEVARAKDNVKHDVNQATLNVKEKVEDVKHGVGL